MNLSWNTPPTRLQLSMKEVHIWQANIDLPAKGVQNLKINLSSDESMRAEEFRFEHDRSGFIATRGILRQILAYYLRIEPGVIRFCYKENGKPRLQSGSGEECIQFNISHSEELALYVFTLGHEVGVDIEYMRPISEMEQIVEQFFSAKERVVFGASPVSKKREIFYTWWTRKEAFTKAKGSGLSYPLDTLDVSMFPCEQNKPLNIMEDANETSIWSIGDIKPAKEYAGAVVVEGRDLNIHCWKWLM